MDFCKWDKTHSLIYSRSGKIPGVKKHGETETHIHVYESMKSPDDLE